MNVAVREFVADCIRMGFTLDEVVDEVRREWIETELRHARNNQLKVASHMGLHRNTLSRHIHELGIVIQRGKKSNGVGVQS
jgi:DNA-binding NtrC family response regulator